jgi:hypothetical protein
MPILPSHSFDFGFVVKKLGGRILVYVFRFLYCRHYEWKKGSHVLVNFALFVLELLKHCYLFYEALWHS